MARSAFRLQFIPSLSADCLVPRILPGARIVLFLTASDDIPIWDLNTASGWSLGNVWEKRGGGFAGFAHLSAKTGDRDSSDMQQAAICAPI